MIPATAGVGTDNWNADAHRVLSESYRTLGVLQAHAMLIACIGSLWNIDRQLHAFLRKVYSTTSSGTAVKPPTVEQLKCAVSDLKRMNSALLQVCDKAAMACENHVVYRMLVDPKVKSIRVSADEILDIAETVELVLDPRTAAHFDKAREELRRGEACSIESIL